MKVVINTCHGGFSISHEAVQFMAGKGNQEAIEMIKAGTSYFQFWEGKRDNHILVEAVETLGTVADGAYAKLKVVEIPDGVEWQVEEYDGREWVAEVHRTWD